MNQEQCKVTSIERVAGMPYTLLPQGEFVQVIKPSNWKLTKSIRILFMNKKVRPYILHVTKEMTSATEELLFSIYEHGL